MIFFLVFALLTGSGYEGDPRAFQNKLVPVAPASFIFVAHCGNNIYLSSSLLINV